MLPLLLSAGLAGFEIRAARVGLAQLPEPGELEELLGEEESGDEEGLGRPEGEVGVVDVLHVGGGQHAVVLGGKVDGEGGRGEPPGCAEGDAHDEWVMIRLWVSILVILST